MSEKSAKLRLLVSGVAPARSTNERETVLTDRLMNGLIERSPDWEHIVSWGEDDGRTGALQKLSNSDALVVVGGPDLNPETYGGPPHYSGQKRHFDRSDRAQIALIQAARHTGMPTLGICRGLQVLNVAFGGTLVQHLADPVHTNRALLENFRLSVHRVKLDPNSRLAGAIGAIGAISDSPEGDQIVVHSAHHQAVDILGDGLTVVARSDDGIVEAVEHSQLPIYGVQWHPEDPDAAPENLSSLLGLLRRHVLQGPPATRGSTKGPAQDESCSRRALCN